MKKLYYPIFASICLIFIFTACRKNVSRPVNNASSTSIKSAYDLDGDGVNNELDAFPNDSSKAYNNFYPNKEFGTLMFDDVWPYMGDYDFNDLVLNYQFNTITSGTNEVAEIEYSFVPRAAGGATGHAFAFQLDGISPDKIESVNGYKLNRNWVKLNKNGTEAEQTTANIVVFDDAFSMFKNIPDNIIAINTFSEAEYYNADTIRLSIKFKPESVSFADLKPTKFNPYIIVNQVRGSEIHLADRMPSLKMNLKEFGKGDDNSNSDEARYFKTKQNFPWAIDVPTSIYYPKEMINITTAYSGFSSWALSNGKNNADWFLAQPGSVDSTKLYKREK